MQVLPPLIDNVNWRLEDLPYEHFSLIQSGIISAVLEFWHDHGVHFGDPAHGLLLPVSGPVEAVCVDNLELFLQLCLAALDKVVRAPARPGSPRLTH